MELQYGYFSTSKDGMPGTLHDRGNLKDMVYKKVPRDLLEGRRVHNASSLAGSIVSDRRLSFRSKVASEQMSLKSGKTLKNSMAKSTKNDTF